MTDTNPAPADQVGQQASVTALVDDQVAPTHFIPQATQDNYAQIARDQAQLRGMEARAVMLELAEQWRALHERQPLDGYDHLAAWAEKFDPSVGQEPSGLAVLQARALESARRDPYQAVIGDQALVAEGVAAQQALDNRGAQSNLEGTGMLPNAGPLPVPADVSTLDPAVAEQQQAAQEQRDQQAAQTADTPPAAATATPTPTPPAPPAPPKNGAAKSSSAGVDSGS